jgi:membrane protein
MNLLQILYQRARHWMTRGIWQPEVLNERSWRGRLCATLRVVSMTWTGIWENNLLSRAAALSYSSMLGLFPMAALMVLFSSTMLDNEDPNFAVKQLNRALEFIAPQLKQMPLPPMDEANAGDAVAAEGETTQVNPLIVGVFNNFIEGTRSKAIATTGAIALILIVLQLLSSIEAAFNDLWGVKRGRNWLLRIVFYWTAVTLGAVLTFAALTLLAGSTLAKTLQSLPFGTRLPQFFELVAPLISLGLLTCLLTVFYKFIPNTTVRWRPALIGGVVTVALLYLNNLLAFLWVERVLRDVTLYGSVSLLAILMVGMYIFWVLLLLGGQITYAAQNANYRSSHLAWNDLNHASRQGVALLAFTFICRRFRDCRPPYDATELADLIKIPTQVVNASLTRLIQLGLISRLPAEDTKGGLDHRFQPARPLNRVTLAEFKDLIESHGAGPTAATLDAIDPVVRQFHARIKRATEEAFGTETFENVLSRLSGEMPAAQTETVGNVSAKPVSSGR